MSTAEGAPEDGLHQVGEPSRKGRLEAYLDGFADETSAHIAEDFCDPARPIADYGVLIPVAAHQEADRIVPAMSEYARQDSDPFTIFMLLNCPSYDFSTTVYDSIAQVETAMRRFPVLDIRYSVLSYDEPIIGQIRKDLWDAALRVALTDGLYDQPGSEVIGINHDIDTERIMRHYMRNVQRFYRRKQATYNRVGKAESLLPPMYTQVKHAYPFATHPNIARAIFWTDFTARQAYRGGEYSEGLAVPFTYYGYKRGFDKTAVIRECDPFDPEDGAGIPGTGMDTSPRRSIVRIGNDTHAEIWTPDSFGSADSCRNPQALPADISHAALEKRILETLKHDLGVFCAGGPMRQRQDTFSSFVDIVFQQKASEQRLFDEVRRRIEPRLRLARFALERVVESPMLAGLIDEPTVNRLTLESIDAFHGTLAKRVAAFGR